MPKKKQTQKQKQKQKQRNQSKRAKKREKRSRNIRKNKVRCNKKLKQLTPQIFFKLPKKREFLRNISRKNFSKRNINGDIESRNISQENKVVNIEIVKNNRVIRKTRKFKTIEQANEFYDNF